VTAGVVAPVLHTKLWVGVPPVALTPTEPLQLPQISSTCVVAMVNGGGSLTAVLLTAIHPLASVIVTA